VNITYPSTNPTKSIGSLLRQRREGSGISQRDLADLTGLSVHTISDIELAKGNPTLEVIGKLCDCLGLELVLQPRKVEASTNAV
jgi:transcriptional regulator with XRE-family HTH domain